MDRDRDKMDGQGHRLTGTGTGIGNRDTDGQWQGHRKTGTGTQTDRDTDRQGQGHKGTGKGTQMDTDRDTDTDIDNFNGQLAKKLCPALCICHCSTVPKIVLAVMRIYVIYKCFELGWWSAVRSGQAKPSQSWEAAKRPISRGEWKDFVCFEKWARMESFAAVLPMPSYASRVAEPAGAETFGRSRSWSQYTEVSAPALAPGQT
jgi:hypothetical protein